MIVVSGHIEVPLHDLSAVKAELINHIALTRAERGCITFSVTQRPEMPTLFDVYEEFDLRDLVSDSVEYFNDIFKKPSNN